MSIRKIADSVRLKECIEALEKCRADLAAAQAQNQAMRSALEACDKYLAGASQPTNRALIKHALSPTSGEGWVRLKWRPISDKPNAFPILCRKDGHAHIWSSVDGNTMHATHWLYASDLRGKEGGK
jgi:hypothetical protein